MIRTTIAAALTLLATTATTYAESAVGFGTRSLPVSHRDVSLPLHVFYPSTGGGQAEDFGQNILFKGVTVQRNAPYEAGRHPVMLFSHGSGGNAESLSWLAAELAAAGIIVIIPNHPGTTSRDSDPFQTIKIWERPQDITATIDWALTTPELSSAIDPDRIGVLGFSLGGNSALELAGALASKADFISYCATLPEMSDCKWMGDAGVDFTQIEQAEYEANLSDPRIKLTVAVDPALAQAYQTDSLAAITIPTLIVNLGADDTIPLAIDGREIAGKIPHAAKHNIDGAVHLSFLRECRFWGRIAVAMMADDPICTDAGTRGRDEIHREAIETILPFLKANL